MANKRQHFSSVSSNIPIKLSQKRFKPYSTLFERLPNELFIEIFSYLSDVDVVYAFSQLNYRFQCLTHNYCNTFDFKSVSNFKFKLVIREHNRQQWKSLRLSDDDDTPGQTTLFFNLFPFTKHSSQLETLSLINMKPKNVQGLIPQLKTFIHLVSLTIGNVCGKNISTLELPSLKYLIINSCKYTKWMKHFHQLESLEHNIEHDCVHENDLVWPAKLKQLKVFYRQPGDIEIVCNSLSHLSELRKLAVYDSAWTSQPPDGSRWENLIISSFPLLEKFHFFFKFWKDSSLISDINQIVSSFSTPFYLEEKRWFIQCDIHYQQFSTAVLYSLPFAFKRFEIITHSFDKSISTLISTDCTNDFNKKIYKNVRTIVADANCENIDQNLISGNIEHLILKFSGTPADWLFSITQLRQLTIGSQINMSYKEFARLLKNTPYLNTLNASYNALQFLTNHWNNKTVCQQLSYKIRSLNLCVDDYMISNTQNYVKVDELLPIVRIFGKRCQHLTVTVYSRNMVAGLILRTMRRLRSLKVYLKEHGNLKITKDWLKEQDITLKDLDCSITVIDNEYSFWFDNGR